MDRIRDGRRGSVSVGGGPPPPRRRLRSNGGGGGGGGPRDSPRSERRRGERLMLNGGGGDGRDDGDDTTDESLGDDDDDAEEELAPRYQPAQRRSPSTAPPPPSPPQPSGGHHHSSSSSGGGGYHNHHHHGQQQQMQRKGGSNPKSPIVLKAADEMIGVPVPRKARSASTKRSSHEWPVPGGGSSGGGAGAGDGSQIQRPSSRPISPASASASTTAPARKKLKLGGGGSSGGSGPAPKQRPSPSSAPSTAPPQPPPPKISKSPSFIQEEIEVAEVLFGLTRQFPCPPKQESNHKLELRDVPEAKSGNSSPAPSSSGVRPSDSTSLATIAPKRKRPRLVKYDKDSRPASPAKPELAQPSSRQEAPPVARSEAKTSTPAAAESGTSSAPASTQLEASREPEKMEDRSRSRDSELRASESDRWDHKLESRAEPPPVPSGKPGGEATPMGSEARNGEATATTKIELASDGARQDKFCIDLMAPPPGKLSPDRDCASDPDMDKKGLDSEMDMLGRGNSEKKDGERTRRGFEIDLEDQKVQRIPVDELSPKKLTLQLDLEKPSLADEKSPSEQRQPHPPPLQQQKSSKSEIKYEKSAMPAVTPPMPIPVGGWLGSFPPFGYLGPVPALSAAGLHHPMDVKPGSSSGLQHAALLPPPPTRSKRCATHCFIAQLIQYHQRLAKMNSFWPPAAAAAANRSAPFFGPRPFNMGVVPPTDATSLLVNPMQGSYPVRAHTPLQEAKAPSMASSPFQVSLSKDKAALGNAAGAEASQRKQPPAHETQQSTPMPNMLQGPAFIFPFNQQHAAAVVAASAANRVGDAKSSGASNVTPPSANAHASAAIPGPAAMNLSFANLQPADAQFLAILQNGGYPFQVAAHAGGPPSYRGMAPPGTAVPFFNGHVYSSHMLHPSQQQGAQQQSLQKNPMPSLSTSSQKHQPQQSQGLLGYSPNANAAAAAAASNSQNYSSGNQRPALLSGPVHRQDGEKTGQNGPLSDDKPSHHQKGVYDHFAVPVHLPNFALMPAAQAAGSQNDKKLSDHHQQQQQPQVSRGQGVRIDLASSQPFVMPFSSIGPPGSAPTGLDFSALAQNHAIFQHQEAARHGYPQLNFAAAQSVQASQHKPHHQITGETKSVAGDSSSTPSAGDERKKPASTKYPGDSQQHSLSFSRTESKSYMPPFLSGSTNESSSRTLSLIGAESPNAFGIGNKPPSSSTPASTPAAATSTIYQQQQQQQQHYLQLQHQKHQQQLIQHHHLNRPRSAAPSTPSNAGGYPDRLNMASFQNIMYSSVAAQGGVQSPQLKASSARVTASSAAATPPAAPPSNLIVMKNSNLHQQQTKVPMQALSTPSHQSQSSLSMSSSKMGPSVTNLSTGGDLSRSSNAPVASGSPSNSVSKSTGGSPPATGSAKGVQQSVQLPSPQQQSAKNPASSSGSKSTPINHYSMAMPSILGQQPNVSPASNPGSKQQSHIPPSALKQQPFPGHFFISNNAFTPQAPGAGGASALGLYQKRPADKTPQQVLHQQNAMSAAASNNMKALHSPSGGFMHLAGAAQSAGGVPHSHMSAAQLTFGAMPMPVKPSGK
ncbi:protein TIME FOR COFFEE-like isoform X2 [Phragmites australis]|uniref:protein TIME FOR COFFEE-like isoform X2 n=1 Tax=Phragmites australis TaxID=29695 RepID=UPI002D77CDA9|nr:protein TIME FOR COFFEE-like isoform X2 [Phragmites australis]